MTLCTAKSFKRLTQATVLATAMTLAGYAHSATTLKLGWTTSDSDVDPYAITAHYFAQELEKAAPGQFDVKFFPNHQLGNDAEMVQGMQFGTLDAGVITGTLIGTIVPAFQLNDLPFLYANSEQAHKVLDGKAGELMIKELAKKNVIGLGFSEAGFRNVINNIRPIHTPQDLKGIKLRVQPSDMFLDSFRDLGANPAPMPWSDTFTAVQQGTVDGLEIPLAVIYANKYPEVTKYLSLTRHSYNALGLLISEKTWGKLSETQQNTVRAAAKSAITRQRQTVADNNQSILGKIEAAGMKVNEVNDVNAFRALVKDVYKKYHDSIGPDIVDAAMSEIQG
ncbi:TRAP transporter substrate-binding protein [Castellaniella sp. GW247-6E4]|uniref:TRAP transporter substrate-binding protein n=1 Tax=Castellaniella sp. GW247-6E4 TaxID=3140380 RepID=UPI00331477B7